jgi:hypothetical protein
MTNVALTNHRVSLKGGQVTHCGRTPESAVLVLRPDPFDEDGEALNLRWNLLIAEGRGEVPMFSGKFSLPVTFCPWCGEKLPTKSEVG